MSQPHSTETTLLLRAWADGRKGALEELTPRVYKQLRRMAGQCMRNESPGRTIQATELVHEAWLQLVDVRNVDWEHHAHFFAVSGTIMRRILLARARRRVTAKRGGEAVRVALDEVPDLSGSRDGELIALDDALKRLAEVAPRKADVIEMRFFGGLSVEETAVVLKVSADTVMRDWRLARAWLATEMNP
jgi:RNA polymerase sigma-70 factor (ECF subfamily)